MLVKVTPHENTRRNYRPHARRMRNAIPRPRGQRHHHTVNVAPRAGASAFNAMNGNDTSTGEWLITMLGIALLFLATITLFFGLL